MNRKLFEPFANYNRLVDIDIPFLRENGIEAIIFDMDNTAIIWHEDTVFDETLVWLDKLRENGIKPVILTNGREVRAVKIAAAMDVEYISLAQKPSPKGYLRAVKLSGKTIDKCLFVGDQLLTDIKGANRVGMKCVLVNPIARQELLWTKLMRRVEKYILKRELIYSKEQEN